MTNISTRVTRKKGGDRAKAKEAMQNFREQRRRMGLLHTSCYIPEDDKELFQLFVERLRAEHYLWLCEQPVNNPGRIALAESNFAAVPRVEDIEKLRARLNSSKLDKQAAELMKDMIKFQTAKMNLDDSDDDDMDALIKTASVAVAYSHYCAMLWKQLQYDFKLQDAAPIEGRQTV